MKALVEGLLKHKGNESGIANQLIAMERFETILEIDDHDTIDEERPSPLSLHNKWSATLNDSLWSREVYELIKLRVPQRTGMSLKELLDLPMEEYRIVLRTCGEVADEVSEVDEDVRTELENMQNRI